jgi:site-specific DNA recombinase
MRRAAVYARFSTDLQSEKSTEDQIALCREYAASNKLAIAATYEDRAMSGASVKNRPDLQRLLADARTRKFDVVLAEDFYRLSRDQADLAELYKKLSFLGVEIETVHNGRANSVTIGVYGLSGQMLREAVAANVHRGMAGVVRSGRHAGGRAYGYRPVRKFDTKGEPVKGELEIVEDEATVIREIFAAYASGQTARQIAADLNERRVKPPRGRNWNASTINGNALRGSGILFNELYIGQITWNKVRMVKNPDTTRRISRPNNNKERTTIEAPHLRIISDDVWQATRMRKSATASVRPEQQRRSPRFLSGLLRCGSCGAGMTTIGRDRKGVRFQCSAFS